MNTDFTGLSIRKKTPVNNPDDEKLPLDTPPIKRLSSLQKEQLEVEMYKIFQEVDIYDMVQQLKKLKEIQSELQELETILKTAKCCIENACSKKTFFCC